MDIWAALLIVQKICVIIKCGNTNTQNSALSYFILFFKLQHSFYVKNGFAIFFYEKKFIKKKQIKNL